MSPAEFSRPVDERQVTAKPITIEATAEERRALARRFGLVAIKQLQARVAIERHGQALLARGRLSAAIVQSCAVSGDDLATAIDEPLAIRFAPETPIDAEELELAPEQLDEMTWRVQPTGYAARDYHIEPDASAATYLWAASVLTCGHIDLGVHQPAQTGRDGRDVALEEPGVADDDDVGRDAVAVRLEPGVEVDAARLLFALEHELQVDRQLFLVSVTRGWEKRIL